MPVSYLPAGHAVQLEAPLEDMEPASQASQITLPVPEAYVPAAHGVQLEAPSVLLYDPGVQLMQLEAPASEYVPAEHIVLTPPAQEYPASHGLHET